MKIREKLHLTQVVDKLEADYEVSYIQYKYISL